MIKSYGNQLLAKDREMITVADLYSFSSTVRDKRDGFTDPGVSRETIIED